MLVRFSVVPLWNVFGMAYSVVMDGDRGLRLTARIPASLESLVVDYALLHGRSRSWAVGRLLLLGLSVAAREVK